ncbi:MAG: TIGR02450 family Trp-rich protein [Pontibacterium sp.]
MSVRINPKKLLHSKWTAVSPKNKEKHFLITEVDFDEEGLIERCLIEAVMTKRSEEIDWQSLKDSSQWRMGWK